MSYLDIILILDGNDVECTVNYSISSYGSPMGGPNSYGPGDPPEAPEWELGSITYNSGPENNELELNWDDLSKEQQDLIEQAIYEDIDEREADYPEPYDD